MKVLKRLRKYLIEGLLIFALVSCGGNSEDAADTTINDEDAIQAVWTRLQNLYASNCPSENETRQFFATYVSPDLRHEGMNREQLQSEYIATNNAKKCDIGATFKILSITDMDATDYETNIYQKGVWLDIKLTNGNLVHHFRTSAVKNGNDDWLWFGDRNYIGLFTEIFEYKWDIPSPNPAISYKTGISFGLKDSNNHSLTNWGIQSAVISGPGFPADGLKMARTSMDDEQFYYWRNDLSSESPWTSINHLSDTSIDAIPLNPTYNLTLCRDTSTDILNGCDATKIISTKIIRFNSKPLKTSELENDALFPTFVAPIGNDIGSFSWNSPIRIQWSNAANGDVFAFFMEVHQNNNDKATFTTMIAEGETSVTIDPSSWNISSPLYAIIGLYHKDSDSRVYSFVKMYYQIN